MEEFRKQLIIAALQGLTANPSTSDFSVQDIAGYSVAYADQVIAQAYPHLQPAKQAITPTQKD